MKEKEKAGLQKLRAAMMAEEMALWEEHAPSEEEYLHSEAYLEKIQALREPKRKRASRVLRTAFGRVAAIALILLVISGSMMSISAVREPVICFFVKVQDYISEIFFPEDVYVPETIEQIYTLTALPDGCEWLTRYVGKKDVTTTWIRDDLTVTLMQTTMESRLFVNNEFAHFSVRNLAETNIAVIERFDMKIYFWNTSEYAYHLMVQGDLSEEACIRMMESLALDTENR